MGLFDKLLGKNKQEEQMPAGNANELVAIADGFLQPIEKCSDPVFSQKMMGDGYLLEPTSNTIVSPVNGTIQTVFPTKHAIGILSEAGDEIIIHVGLDTVKLNGEGFTTFVEAGDKVAKGQKLLEVDFAGIKDKVPSIATPVVISNINDRKVAITGEKSVKAGEVALTIG